MDIEKIIADKLNASLESSINSEMFGTSTNVEPQESVLTPEIFQKAMDRVKVMKPVTQILISTHIKSDGRHTMVDIRWSTYDGRHTMVDRSKIDFLADAMCGHKDFIRLAREYRKHGFKVKRVWKRYATALYEIS